jgi:hypothetical protein
MRRMSGLAIRVGNSRGQRSQSYNLHLRRVTWCAGAARATGDDQNRCGKAAEKQPRFGPF